MAFFLNSKCFKVYPYLISLVAVKNCAHRQKNHSHTEHLSGPKPPATFDDEEKCNFQTLMKEAARRAQRFIVAEAAKYHIPGISYSVALDEVDPFVSTYGFVDMENNKQIQNTSVLRIGYITMLYTAFLAIEMSNISGKIQLKDSIETVLNGFPEKCYAASSSCQSLHTITLNNILCHTSGLKDYTDDELKSVKRENLDMILRKAVEDHTLLVTIPGTFSFARYPYMLISIIIREVYHTSYSTAIRKSMTNLYGLRPWLFTDNTIGVIKGLSRHYQRNNKGILQPATYVNPKNREAIYGLVATSDTLSCFGLKLVRNSKDNKTSMYKGTLKPDQAQFLFKPLTEDPVFDSSSGETVWPCIFGRSIYTEDNSRMPTAWCSSSVIGSSSILLVKGFLQDSRSKTTAKSSIEPAGTDISVSVICNLEGVELYSIANQIAGVYQDALKSFYEWRKSYKLDWYQKHGVKRTVGERDS